MSGDDNYVFWWGHYPHYFGPTEPKKFEELKQQVRDNIKEGTKMDTKVIAFPREWIVSDSDWIKSIAYNLTERSLKLITKRGNTYIYTNVSEISWACITSASSVGAAFNRLMKDFHHEVM